MSRSAADLPEDPAELRRFAAALAAEVHSKTLLIEKLRMQLAVLRRARFGRSSEKLDREIEQLELLLGDIEKATPSGRREPRLPTAKLLPPCRRRSRPSARLCPIICRSRRSCTKRPASADLRRNEVRPDRRR
jgi:Transposase C of IS166 homeodomain